MKREYSLPKVASIVLPAVLLLTWEFATRWSLLPPSLAAPPSTTIVHAVLLLVRGTLGEQVLYSMGRLFAAVAIGSFVGTTSGLVLGTLPIAERMVSPTLRLLGPVPVVVWIPFVIVAFGTEEAYKIGLAALGTFFIVHLGVFRAVQSMNRHYIELARIYEKTWWDKIRQVLLPGVLPSVFTSLRLAFALGWVVVFFVEYGSSTQGSEGLGWFIYDARSVGRVEDEYAGVFVLALLGFVTDTVLTLLQNRKLKWMDSASDHDEGAE